MYASLENFGSNWKSNRQIYKMCEYYMYKFCLETIFQIWQIIVCDHVLSDFIVFFR